MGATVFCMCVQAARGPRLPSFPQVPSSGMAAEAAACASPTELALKPAPHHSRSCCLGMLFVQWRSAAICGRVMLYAGSVKSAEHDAMVVDTL